MSMTDTVNHPAHYGGEDNPYEVIKVAEAFGFDKDAYLFNVLKYIARPAKGDYLEDLKKARFYLDRKIARIEIAAASSENELAYWPLYDPRHAPALTYVDVHHQGVIYQVTGEIVGDIAERAAKAAGETPGSWTLRVTEIHDDKSYVWFKLKPERLLRSYGLHPSAELVLVKW